MSIHIRFFLILSGLVSFTFCNSIMAQPVSETAFTYQGLLQQGGDGVSEQCDFEFSLWTDSNNPNPGVQVGTEIQLTSEVANGVFNAELDFGADVMSGDARWLHIAVCCASPCAPGYTDLAPRQAITSTPYSIQTRGIFVSETGDVGIGTDTPNAKLKVEETAQRAAIRATVPNYYAIRGTHTSTAGSFPGLWGDTNSTDNSATGVRGYINTTNAGGGSAAVRGINQGTNDGGSGVRGSHAGSGIGVMGEVANSAGYAGYFIGGRNYFQGKVGVGVVAPNTETMFHARVTGDDFGVLVDAAGSVGSPIGLHSGPSGYSSLAKNAFFAGGWKKFNISAGSFLQEIDPTGVVTFNVSPTGFGDAINWTNAMTFKSDGKVGMGTANPTEKLHIIGNEVVQGNVDVSNNLIVGGNIEMGYVISTADCNDGCFRLSVPCPANMRALGGGCTSNDPMQASGPLVDGRGWTCDFESGGDFRAVTAICARVD